MQKRVWVGAVLAGLVTAVTSASAAPKPVTVFLERSGQVVEHDGEEIAMPKFGGGDRAWTGIVTCVKQQFSPFQIDVVDQRPARGEFITAVVGGRASQLGLDDGSTNGVGPYSPDHVIRNAVVHVFSKVGTGEKDVQNLCAVTVHEVSHSLGLDHTYKCGDVMSYFLDRCGARRFLDVDSPCGEDSRRACGDGSRTQNSYRRVAAAVGLRTPDAEPEPDTTDADRDDPSTDPAPTSDDDYDPATDVDDEPERTTVRGRDGHLYSVEQIEGRNGRRWLVLRRIR
ncbi:MAG: matrixin family metalloprotease [Kofleriaceae bacterium]